jgi:hypothetical protein
MATHSRQRMIASRLRVWLTALFAWCSGVCSAHAEPELALAWPEVPGCPDLAWVERRVHERLGRALDDRAPQSLHASAVILTQPSGLTLTLHVEQDGREGVREINASNCSDLAEAAALVLALAIDASHLAQRDSQPADLTPPDPVVPEVETPKPSRAAQRQTAAKVRDDDAPPWRAYAGLLLDVASLPSPSVGPAAAVAYQRRRYRVELAGMWLAPRASSGREGRVAVNQWALAPTGCADLLGRAITLSACAAVELGRSIGRGRQLSESVRAGALHGAALLGLRLGLPLLANARLVGETAALLPFQRARFVSLDTNDQAPASLHEPALLSLRARLAVELRF